MLYPGILVHLVTQKKKKSTAKCSARRWTKLPPPLSSGNVHTLRGVILEVDLQLYPRVVMDNNTAPASDAAGSQLAPACWIQLCLVRQHYYLGTYPRYLVCGTAVSSLRRRGAGGRGADARAARVDVNLREPDEDFPKISHFIGARQLFFCCVVLSAVSR